VPATIDAARRTHILDGDATGGGHRAGTGKPGKSEFPVNWTDDEVISRVEEVANDPHSSRRNGRLGRAVVSGTCHGVDIEVVIEANGTQIVTGYPTNIRRNP